MEKVIKIFNFKREIFLLFIICIASFLRLYYLSNVPPSASIDEASTAYNAYSILKTGADEYGTKFPLILRSFDDFQPAFYTYLVVPFVKLFGLNIISVRLPSAILSILTVLATYFLVLEFFKKHIIAATSSLLFAISPWHIYLTRIGFPSTPGSAFFIFALLFFLRRNIYISFICFSLSFISYHAEKFFIPLIFLGILLVYRKELLHIKRKVFLAACLSLIIVAPFLKVTFSQGSLIRFQGTTILNPGAVWQQNENRKILLNEAKKKGDVIGRIYNSEKVFYARLVLEGYSNHFSFRWLFANSGNEPHKVPGLGLLYVWEFPFIIIGLLWLIVGGFNPKAKMVLLLWMVSAPVASSFTTDAPHALRSLVFLPLWQIFSSLGIVFLFQIIRNKVLQKIGILLIGSIIVMGMTSFYKQYFFVFPKEQSESFYYAFSQTIPFVLKEEKKYNKIIFSNKENLYQSYMLFLFYAKYNPALYQKQGGTKSGGYAQSHIFDKYEFRPISFEEDKKTKDILLVGNPSEFPPNVKALYKVRYLDGKAGSIIVSTDEE